MIFFFFEKERKNIFKNNESLNFYLKIIENNFPSIEIKLFKFVQRRKENHETFVTDILVPL